MIWVVPLCLLLAIALTWLADRALREPPEPEREPCSHPWFMDERCVVCGEPR